MKLAYSDVDEAFRLEVRTFVAQKLPQWLKKKVENGQRLEHGDYLAWFEMLHERGWITPSWPIEHGGTGWSPLQKAIFDEETLLGGAPRVVASGIQMLGPVLARFGTPEQKSKHLPAIRASTVWWAQGFSETGAGSDLASLRTSAVEVPATQNDASHFLLNGHKVWTSYAQWCSWMFALVRTRTEGKPQESISFLLIDLSSPGVTVRPIRMLENGTDLNEVYLDNVKVPTANLVGELHRGWDCAKYLLGFERTGIAGIGSCKQQLMRLKRVIGAKSAPALSALHAELWADRIATFEIELMALEATSLRLLSANQKGLFPGIEASVLKVKGTELRQAIYAALVEAGGQAALILDDAYAMAETADDKESDQWLAMLGANYLDARKLSIYGGTNEVQRNMIARAALS
jgi:alkylation response protein AidB-like acyl-CoA dehydrogenase